MARETLNLYKFYSDLESRPTIDSVSPITGTDSAAQDQWVDSTLTKLNTAIKITSQSATDLAAYIVLKTAEKTAQESLLGSLTMGSPQYEIVQATISTLSSEIDGLKAQLADLKSDLENYKGQQTSVSAYRTTTAAVQPSSSTASVSTVSSVEGSSANYKYNFPMVKTAYHSSKIQLESAATSTYSPSTVVPGRGSSQDSYIIDPWNYKDAITAWNGYATGGKGALQMSRRFNNSWPGVNPATKYRDDTLYGFRFMYNPTNVSMAWGVSTEVAPQFEAQGADVATAMTSSILNSTISLELVLNRIEDFNYINENGLRDSGVNPYPGTAPDVDELKKIYEKGTMYDIEYLLKVLYGKSAEYMSTLNGLTADRGYLTGWAVELHLGKNMRYLVRVGTMELTHSVFNAKMVPLLSTLSLTCTRYPDFAPDTFDPNTTTAPESS